MTRSGPLIGTGKGLLEVDPMQNTLERRHVLRAAGAAGAAAFAGLAISEPAQANEGSNGRNAVVGSWIVTHTDNPPGDPTPGKGVVTLGPGGILENVEISPAGGVGAGAWTSTGGRRFRAVFLTGGGGQTPNDPAVIVEVRPRGRVTEDDKISGTYTLTVSNAATGAVLASGTGKFDGTRLKA